MCVPISNVRVDCYYLKRVLGLVYTFINGKSIIGVDIEPATDSVEYCSSFLFALAGLRRNSRYCRGRCAGSTSYNWRMVLYCEATEERHYGREISSA